MPYIPPTGDTLALEFRGTPPPIPSGANMLIAFAISAVGSTSQAQTNSGNALNLSPDIGSAAQTMQGGQAGAGVGVASVWVTTVQNTTSQGGQTSQLIAIYVPPIGNNVIIDLGTGAYAAPVGNNVIIDLGDTVAATSYTKFLYFIIDTMMFS